jgi:hypothetical protein
MHYLDSTSILYYQFTQVKQSEINMHKSVIPIKVFTNSTMETNLDKLSNTANHIRTTEQLWCHISCNLLCNMYTLHKQQTKKPKIITDSIGRHLTTSRSHSCPQRRSEWRKSSFLSPACRGSLHGESLTCKT